MDRRDFIKQTAAVAAIPTVPEITPREGWVHLAKRRAAEEEVEEILLEVLMREPNAEGVVLYWAVNKRFPELVELLKHAVALTTSQEIEWVHRLEKESPPVTPSTAEFQLPFERAAAAGNLECLKILGARADANYLQATLEAATFGRLETCRYLLSLGKPEVDAKAGDSLFLRHACAHGGGVWGPNNEPEATEVVKLLLSQGADPNAVNPNNARWTALASAAHWGNEETVKVLLAAGADPKQGAPLEEAHNYPKITKVLIEAGAPKPPLDFLKKLLRLNRSKTLLLVLDGYPWTKEELQSLLEEQYDYKDATKVVELRLGLLRG